MNENRQVKYEVIDTQTGAVYYRGYSFDDALEYAHTRIRNSPFLLKRTGLLVHKNGSIKRYYAGTELLDL